MAADEQGPDEQGPDEQQPDEQDAERNADGHRLSLAERLVLCLVREPTYGLLTAPRPAWHVGSRCETVTAKISWMVQRRRYR